MEMLQKVKVVITVAGDLKAPNAETCAALFGWAVVKEPDGCWVFTVGEISLWEMHFDVRSFLTMLAQLKATVVSVTSDPVG